jgi:hypothetical protein
VGAPRWRRKVTRGEGARGFDEKFEQPGGSGSERRRVGKERRREGLIGEVLKTIYLGNEERSDLRRGLPNRERERN